MGMRALEIEYPEDLLDQFAAAELQALARESLYVHLYALGHISSGRAAQLLDISRRAFLDLLGRYNVSLFDEHTDLDEDLQNARLGSAT